MTGISQKRFQSTIRGPAAAALESLAGSSEDIIAAWCRELRSLGLEIKDFVTPLWFDFDHFAEVLRETNYETLQRQIQEFGGALAQKGVKLELATAAFDRLFEICLGRLDSVEPGRATPILALARLHSLIGLFVIYGHSGQGKTLIETSLSEEEDRAHEASAYVTRVYEQERRRLSQDLHDDVGHDLILIKLYLEMIALDTQGHDLPEIRPRLGEAIALVSRAIDSVRRLTSDLGPAVFDDLGFQAAMKSYGSQFASRTKIPVKFQEGHLPPNIPMSHQVALYRVLQGALSNVLKHAKAKQVTLWLGSLKDSVLMMVVEDDGVGFDPLSRPRRSSFGLTAMRERVELLGGRIHIESTRASSQSKTHGTRIEVDLPLPGGGEG